MKNLFSLFILTCVFSSAALAFDKAKLDKYIESLDTHDKAMFSVAVVQNGQPIYQKSIGYVDIETKQAANKSTQYRIGSITKVFTSTMIFQLIDEGKLALDTKLATFYPQIKNAELISMSMLLNHRSGIHNFTDTPDYEQYMTKAKTKAEMVSLIGSLDSDFTPDSAASYSNSGYVLLGFIIEDITNDSYENQLHKRITAKVNLNRTTFGGPVKPSDNQAHSYKHATSEWVAHSETDMSIPYGAGAIISTSTEVGIFIENLMTGKLTSANSLAKMKELNQGYGRGLFAFPFHERIAYGHTGGIDGFTSHTGYIGDDEVVFTLTSNGMNMSMNDISIAILSIYYDMPFDLPDFGQKAITLTERELSQYQGVFSSKQIALNITLKTDGAILTAQATGQKAFNLTSYSSTDFRFDPAGIKIQFATQGEKVNYTTFALKQGGGKYTFIRE